MQNNYKQRLGRFGEKLALNYLIKNGYKILTTNVKISYQEIDIIAKLGNELIFIEVKTRSSRSFGTADENITSKKINNLKKALNQYINKEKLNYKNIRLDFISIDIERSKKIAKIKHYKNII